MLFDPVAEAERKRFFRQNYAAHLPGYTGHCPTLKFRVGKRFGACTQEIMKELLEKKVLKTGPYRPNSGKENATIFCEQDNEPVWRHETHLYKAPPYILGYTGYIPGFNSRYGLSFMRAVEEGAKEWRENQRKLRASRDAIRSEVEVSNISRQCLPRIDTDSDAIQIDDSHEKNRGTTFYYEISPERPPIVGYTGHIPGAKGELSLSRRYAEAAKKGLELIRDQRLSKLRSANVTHRISNSTCIDETNLART